MTSCTRVALKRSETTETILLYHWRQENSEIPGQRKAPRPAIDEYVPIQLIVRTQCGRRC